MTSDAITFINSSIIGSAALGAQGISGSQQFIGGRAAISISATQFGNAVNVQFLAGNLWIPICSTFLTSQIFSFDAPAGQYRLVSSGSSIGMAASLVRIPY